MLQASSCFAPEYIGVTCLRIRALSSITTTVLDKGNYILTSHQWTLPRSHVFITQTVIEDLLSTSQWAKVRLKYVRPPLTERESGIWTESRRPLPVITNVASITKENATAYPLQT